MFDINVGSMLTESLVEETVQKAIKLYKNETKSSRISHMDSLVMCTEIAVNIAVNIVEENNKALWNELVKRGIVKE